MKILIMLLVLFVLILLKPESDPNSASYKAGLEAGKTVRGWFMNEDRG